jgi:hypothetical protein
LCIPILFQVFIDVTGSPSASQIAGANQDFAIRI